MSSRDEETQDSTAEQPADPATDSGGRTSSRVQREASAHERRSSGRRSSGRRSSGRRSSGDGSTRRAEGLLDEVLELQQGLLHTTIEAASTGLDTATRVTRNSVDRAFAKDYRDPGDVLRNLGDDVGDTVRDVLDGMRDGPRRMSDGFYDVVRPSSRTRDRGERHRRAQGDDE